MFLLIRLVIFVPVKQSGPLDFEDPRNRGSRRRGRALACLGAASEFPPASCQCPASPRFEKFRKAESQKSQIELYLKIDRFKSSPMSSTV